MPATLDRSLERQWNPATYQVQPEGLLTPSLLIYPEIVRHNIARTIALLEGRPERWRPHLKTAKLASVIRMLVEAGVQTAKCATSLELLIACEAGMRDVLVAYPHSGANARRIADIAARFPDVRVSALVEAPDQIESWSASGIDLFIDINPGMDRTGIDEGAQTEVIALAQQITAAGLTFRGLHFYDGNSTEADIGERTRKAHARYDGLLALRAEVERAGVEVNEIITSGTPAMPCAVDYRAFWHSSFSHQISPGTVVYNDASDLAQLPAEYALEPAAFVLSRVVSRPKPDVTTCDAGHKSLSVDSGVPNCVVVGYPRLEAMKPSEEHLPLRVAPGAEVPPLGAALLLLPRHICPTVNSFDFAAFVQNGKVVSVEPVSARGREGPLLARAARDGTN